MRSPAFGLGWLIWRRHHLGLTLFAAYLLTLVIAVHLTHAGLSPSALNALTTPFGGGMLYLLSIFANSDTDLASTRSGYSYSLFTLPVRTRTLIFWPMVYAIVTVVTVWIAFAGLVLAPTGTGAILWWPATLLAALAASLQALAWYPIPLPHLRGILAFVLLAAMSGLGAWGWANGVAPGRISIIYLATIPIAALVATRGVSLARSGESRERAWLPERRRVRSLQNRFASPAWAQIWLEWQRNGILLPLFTLLISLLFAIPLALGSRDMVPLFAQGISSITVSIAERLWLVCLFLIPLTAMSIGCCPSKAATYRPDLTLQPFLATRPISTLDLVLAKLRMAAMSTLGAWAILLLFLAAWLQLPARNGDASGSIGSFLLPYLTLKATLVLALACVCMVVWTWKCQVSALWVELTGRRWFVMGYSLGLPMLTATVIGGSATKLTMDPTSMKWIVPFLAPLAVGLALLKGTAVLGAYVALRRFNLVTAPRLQRFLTVWILAFSSLCGLLIWLLPPHLVPTHYLVLGVFLFLPLARLLFAPLALLWNRHR